MLVMCILTEFEMTKFLIFILVAFFFQNIKFFFKFYAFNFGLKLHTAKFFGSIFTLFLSFPKEISENFLIADVLVQSIYHFCDENISKPWESTCMI